jgi:hypothetical protein
MPALSFGVVWGETEADPLAVYREQQDLAPLRVLEGQHWLHPDGLNVLVVRDQADSPERVETIDVHPAWSESERATHAKDDLLRVYLYAGRLPSGAETWGSVTRDYLVARLTYAADRYPDQATPMRRLAVALRDELADDDPDLAALAALILDPPPGGAEREAPDPFTNNSLYLTPDSESLRRIGGVNGREDPQAFVRELVSIEVRAAADSFTTSLERAGNRRDRP